MLLLYNSRNHHYTNKSYDLDPTLNRLIIAHKSMLYFHRLRFRFGSEVFALSLI
jgi:hypothetical protein